MFIINGTPIMNCLDFYRCFDITEVLNQPKEFAVFAENHLGFNKINNHCIEMLKLALNHAEEITCTSFWQGKTASELDPKRIGKTNNIIDEAYGYYKKYAKENNDSEWARKYIISVAATILAEKKGFDIPVKKQQAEKKIEQNILSVDKDSVTIIPGKTYFCKHDSSVIIDSGTKMRTVEVIVASGYSSNVTIMIENSKQLQYASGDIFYMNVYNDTVVNILPNEVKNSHGILRRDTKKGCITYNGMETNIPVTASSFACMGEGKYLYLKNNMLSYIGIRQEFIPDILCNRKANYIEVFVEDNEYYLLSSAGVIKTLNGTPPSMCNKYTSLNKAVKER